ncbi:MAG: 5'-nucleotidase C-terminal domain-containing protein [Myxococcaceae bacterium]|nr:5'-nucleotidase C-terminal domain-containing protein [Myxococcaceae bacterium]
MTPRILPLLLSLPSLVGCIAFNDDCQALVDNPNERVAFIAKGTEIYLDRPNARHGNNAIAQSAADAFVWVFNSQPDATTKVDFGLINGGAVRDQGACVLRTILREGPLTRGVLGEILPFENVVRVVDLSEQEVFDTLELSVSRLFAAPTPITSPAGGFLQVSREVSMEVDCSRMAGSRITSLRIGSQTITRGMFRPFPATKLRVAIPGFILAGNDGYTLLAGKGDDPSRNPGQAQRFSGIDSRVTMAYLLQSDFNKTVENGIRVDPMRIRFLNCTTPSRPAQ